MSINNKKIAFSFSKVKKPLVIKNKADSELRGNKEYVDCFDGSKGKFSYKGSYRNDTPHKQELVIPMPVRRTSTDVVNSRIEEKVNKNLNLNEGNSLDETNSEESKGTLNQSHNIEELATFEILNEVKNSTTENKKSNNLIIKSKDWPEETIETDIDYENVPVIDFGLAMLRGMGWKPDLGIGKEPRIVEAISPKLRLKGLGLGAQSNADKQKKTKDYEKKSTKSSKDKQTKH